MMKLHMNFDIGSIFMELDFYFSFYKGYSVFLTCIYENHHCFSAHEYSQYMQYALPMNNIEQTNKQVVYGNQRSEYNTVQTKKKKNSLYMTVLNFSFTSHYFIKYLSEFFLRTISILKKKIGTKNQSLIQVITGL